MWGQTFRFVQFEWNGQMVRSFVEEIEQLQQFSADTMVSPVPVAATTRFQ